ncbi:MAG: GH3 family domain-containing protein [Gemmatimonadales bacterium]
MPHWFQPVFTTLFAPRFARFARRLANPAAAQRVLLRRILRQVARTEYGRGHRITGREDYIAFRDQLPIVAYEDLRDWIERQSRSRAPVIAPEPVRVYEKTSGSTGRQKLIPYTPSLLRSFDRMAFLWAYDLLRHGPQFTTGRLFFSVSAPFQDERSTASGVPVSLDDDSEYLSPLMRRLFGSCFVHPRGLKGLRDPVQYRRVLAATLVAEARLEVLFIWNPTYLTALFELVEAERSRLMADLRAGAIAVQGRVFPLASLDADRRRALERTPIDWSGLWPELKLISCWTDAGTAPFARRLGRLFPGVLMQGKGLLATEAPLTVPLLRASAPVPLVDEVFFEFEGGDGEICLLHELEDDAEYEVIVTQQGGLCRYRINDRVSVSGRYADTPCLRFVGRARDVSDLVGEKLHEAFVRAALQRAFPGDDGFAFLVPVRTESGTPYYLCLADRAPAGVEACAQRLDAELMEAFHYRQARLLGQLGSVQLVVRADAQARYDDHCAAQGMKWGDIKYAALLRSADARAVTRFLAA